MTRQAFACLSPSHAESRTALSLAVVQEREEKQKKLLESLRESPWDDGPRLLPRQAYRDPERIVKATRASQVRHMTSSVPSAVATAGRHMMSSVPSLVCRVGCPSEAWLTDRCVCVMGVGGQVRELTDEELEEREKRRVRAGAHEQVMAGMGRDLMFAGRAVPDWRRAMSGVM